MKTSIYILLLLSTSHALLADEPQPSKIQNIRAELDRKTPIPFDIAKVSDSFQEALNSTDLSPSPDLQKEVSAVKEIVVRLIGNLGKNEANGASPETLQVSASVKATLTKFDSIIDENYQFQKGTANVSPPPGVPNATSGMNPYAIEDPKLREQYLKLIAQERAKQYKNVQQAELKLARKAIILNLALLDSWRKAAGLAQNEFIERFTSEGESRKALRMAIIPKEEPRQEKPDK